MKNLLSPKWLLIVNTLPITIYLILSAFQFNIVRTLLSEDDLILWGIFGGVLLLLAGGVFAHSLRATYLNKEISGLYASVSLVSHIAYMVFYLYYFEDVLRGLPNWMISADFYIYAITFIMPTIVHSLFVLVLKLNNGKFQNAWLNLLSALAIPFFIYVLAEVVLPFWDFGNSEIGEIIGIFLFSFFTVSFLFFVVRAIYLFSQKQKERSRIFFLIWRILLAIVFPIAGLLLNQGFIGTNFSIENDRGIFGNFSGYSFYIIALLNGILVCLPERENPKYRLALFAGRAIGFTYVTYFFLVFLPFLPLSVIAVLLVGLGFLMLTPLVLFVLQGQILYNDYVFLKQFNPTKKLMTIVTIGFLILPTAIIIDYSVDKKVLNETLDYIYYPDYSKKYDLNENSIRRILSNVKANKKGSNGFLMPFDNRHTPFLSQLYTWLVLDNMTLSDRKIKKIETVFYGKSSTKSRRFSNRTPIDGTVDITDYKIKSEYDKQQDAWLTWVDFEMTNTATLSGQREFDVAFDLPAGCWISDYYLDIEDRREAGILAEKRAAVWIYQQITNTRRDPGLLNYVGADKVRFRVFPFAQNEVRTTGIQFLHKEPVKVEIANQIIQLGDTLQSQNILTATDLTENMVYVSTAAKSKLSKVKRQPYYHFIIDISDEMKGKSGDYTTRLNRFIQENEVDIAKAEFNFTNTYSNVINGNNWKRALNNQAFEGGFYFERAVKKCLFNAYENRKNEYPIIIVLSENSLKNYVIDDFSEFEKLFPEVNKFYKITSTSNLIAGDLSKISLEDYDYKAIIAATPTVLAYPNAKNPIAYLLNNQEASIVLKNSIFDNNVDEISEKNWQSALTMQGNWQAQTLHPEISETEYYKLVKSSFKSGIMTPTTSFLALENEAQKQMLYKKQRETLNGNKALDIGEQPDPMPEPEIWILLILFGVFLGLRKWKTSVN